MFGDKAARPKRTVSKSQGKVDRVKVKVSLTGRVSVDPYEVLHSKSMARTLEQLAKIERLIQENHEGT